VPLEWEGRKWNGEQKEQSNCWKADQTLSSFIFTIKNPAGFAPTKFPLKAERQRQAINYCSMLGARLGYEIVVDDNCNSGRQTN
jgi:hypothetical protein